jgi:hypothetical protein
LHGAIASDDAADEAPDETARVPARSDVSDIIELGMLGESVKQLQEDMRGLRLALDIQSQTLTATLQVSLQKAADVIGQNLAVQDRRIDNLTNVLKEHIEETAKTLARIEAKLPG